MLREVGWQVLLRDVGGGGGQVYEGKGVDSYKEGWELTGIQRQGFDRCTKVRGLAIVKREAGSDRCTKVWG